MILTAALAVPGYEKGNPDSSISNFGEGLWWAFVTAAAVGYGDHVPVTVGGRIVAVVLMYLGITFISTVVGLVASHYSQRKANYDWDRVFKRLEAMEERLERIEKKTEYLVKQDSSKDV